MSLPVNLERAAEDEMLEAARYYESQRRGLGDEFLTEFARTVERIAVNPEAWAMVTPRSRHHRLRRFPYGLIYQIRSTEILVIAVAHLRRDQTYWRDRER